MLGQHVMVGSAGTVAGSSGPITSAADSLEIRLFGRGAHGSMPQASVDPVVMAAALVLRLQTIVSRETAATGHPAFVGVHDAGITEDGCAFIEMERLAGRDLARRPAQQQREGVLAGELAARARAAVRGLGQVHADLVRRAAAALEQ